MYTTWDYFVELDIKVGEIINVETYSNTEYYLAIDFGTEAGMRKAIAELRRQYEIDELLGKQVIGIVNLPVKQIEKCVVDSFVLGVKSAKGVILLKPDSRVKNGEQVE